MTSTINLPLLRKGKVREVYDAGNRLLIIASDRVSTFDHVLPTPIDGKGKILTEISNFWFAKTVHIVPNHLLSSDIKEINEILKLNLDPAYYGGRTVLVKKADRIDFECVVRGFAAGSAWKEYKEKGTICGESFAPGLIEAEKLPKPIFTPATKMDSGHDENVPYSYMAEKLGEPLASRLRDVSVKLYNFAYDYLNARGIVLADTKFEFGLVGGELTLIDEALTPDSSRFWDAAVYKPGKTPQSFDKQFIRDYMESTGWDKNSAPPEVPQNIVGGAVKKYKEALDRILKGSL